MDLDSNSEFMIYPLGPPTLQRCCSNCDNPDYQKLILLRTFKVADSQSIWKVCSDHKDDPDFSGTSNVVKSSLIRESICTDERQ
ncbi:hypothetical protein [Nitrosopumilus piranensis]|nr:hypothetical protein [Nitrosopumilus piranensis]